MSKLLFQTKTKTALADSKKITKANSANNLFKAAEKVTLADKMEVAKVTKEVFDSIKVNDKSLTEIEIEYERKAEFLNVNRFSRIHPRKATIGFILRGLDGGNHQAIEYVRNSLPAYDKHGKIKALIQDDDLKELIKEFDSMDESSQLRVDCIDWLCRRFEINIAKFLDKMQTGLLEYNNRITSILLSEKKPELADKIMKFATNEAHAADRKLAAEMTGLTKPQSVVSVDNSKTGDTINNNLIVPSFAEFVSERNKQAKRLVEAKDFVEGTLIND